jgi:hypothetical protein
LKSAFYIYFCFSCAAAVIIVIAGIPLVVANVVIVVIANAHRHLSNIDCLKARTACLVCFISTVNGHSKKDKEALKDRR